ncbi:MAG: TlyA family RNA methyltransferase, partial [Anaerolineaceae bacterium]
VNGQPHFKPAEKIDRQAVITLTSGPRFVSRGGEKLQAALDVFKPSIKSRICADVGASTGGFTDCLLQAGAAKVYAIDVGYGQIALKLRNDERVMLMERTNARYIERLPDSIDLVTIDASFISLKILLQVVNKWLDPLKGGIIALVKPQFEAGRKITGRGKGVILDENVHKAVVTEILEFSSSLGLIPVGLIYSPLTGPKGNREFLIHLMRQTTGPPGISALLEDCFSTKQDAPGGNKPGLTPGL